MGYVGDFDGAEFEGWEVKFHKLRRACCDLLGEMDFDEQNATFCVDINAGEEFERVVRSLPPKNTLEGKWVGV